MLSEELITLQSIYVNELQLIKLEGELEKIRVDLYPATAEKQEEQFVFMTLEFTIPEKYPDELPEIAVCNPRGLGEEAVNNLLATLKAMACERKGQTMLYDIIVFAKERLTNSNIPNGECAICLESFHQGQPFQKTKCFHHFHIPCLCKYMQGSGNSAKVAPNDTDTSACDTNKEVLCPICREVLDITLDKLTLALSNVTLTTSVVEETDAAVAAVEIITSPKIQEMQQKMQELFARQLEKGGIIDTEAENQKLLLTPGMTITMEPSLLQGNSPRGSYHTSPRKQPAKYGVRMFRGGRRGGQHRRPASDKTPVGEGKELQSDEYTDETEEVISDNAEDTAATERSDKGERDQANEVLQGEDNNVALPRGTESAEGVADGVKTGDKRGAKHRVQDRGSQKRRYHQYSRNDYRPRREEGYSKTNKSSQKTKEGEANRSGDEKDSGEIVIAEKVSLPADSVDASLVTAGKSEKPPRQQRDRGNWHPYWREQRKQRHLKASEAETNPRDKKTATRESAKKSPKELEDGEPQSSLSTGHPEQTELPRDQRKGDVRSRQDTVNKFENNTVIEGDGNAVPTGDETVSDKQNAQPKQHKKRRNRNKKSAAKISEDAKDSTLRKSDTRSDDVERQMSTSSGEQKGTTNRDSKRSNQRRKNQTPGISESSAGETRNAKVANNERRNRDDTNEVHSGKNLGQNMPRNPTDRRREPQQRYNDRLPTRYETGNSRDNRSYYSGGRYDTYYYEDDSYYYPPRDRGYDEYEQGYYRDYNNYYYDQAPRGYYDRRHGDGHYEGIGNEWRGTGANRRQAGQSGYRTRYDDSKTGREFYEELLMKQKEVTTSSSSSNSRPRNYTGSAVQDHSSGASARPRVTETINEPKKPASSDSYRGDDNTRYRTRPVGGEKPRRSDEESAKGRTFKRRGVGGGDGDRFVQNDVGFGNRPPGIRVRTPPLTADRTG